MGAFIDTIGSIIIGGIVLLMLVVFNGNVMESAATQTLKVNVQGNLTTVTNIVEYDFRKMGYRVLTPPFGTDSIITYADSTKIKFKADLYNNGIMDTVLYYIDSVRSSLTENPYDKVLHRFVSNPTSQTGQSLYLGMIGFKLQYYDKSDSLIKFNPVPSPSKIKSIRIAISVQSVNRVIDNRQGRSISNPFMDTTYSGGYWERVIKPKNVR